MPERDKTACRMCGDPGTWQARVHPGDPWGHARVCDDCRWLCADWQVGARVAEPPPPEPDRSKPTPGHRFAWSRAWAMGGRGRP